MKDIKFGDWIIIDSRLQRNEKYKRSENENYIEYGNRFKYWIGYVNRFKYWIGYVNRFKYWGKIKTEKKKAIFLGERTLFNGTTPYDHDAGYSFEVEETIKAALVCESPRMNPFYVLLEDIRRL